MTDMKRRAVTMLALLAPLAKGRAQTKMASLSSATPPSSHDMSSMPASWTRRDQIAMLVYPRMTALDLIGPQYMFAALLGAKVHLVGKTLDPVSSDTGVSIAPSITFEDCPKDLTVLFAPGGTEGRHPDRCARGS
jgi:putative intracellular protease/amidase